MNSKYLLVGVWIFLYCLEIVENIVTEVIGESKRKFPKAETLFGGGTLFTSKSGDGYQIVGYIYI